MVVQMRDECYANSSTLDIDQILRNLQAQIPDINGFTRIGPFGILPTAMEKGNDIFQGHNYLENNTMEGNRRGSTAELDQVLVDSNWGQLEDFQAWDTIVEECVGTMSMVANLEEPNFYDQASYPNLSKPSGPISYLDRAQDLDISNLPATPITNMALKLPSSSNARPDPSSNILTMSNDANMCKIPAEARLLLDYYSCRIIDVMSMSPGNKPPWKTIHLPCAMSALAELMVYGETRSFAKMALFYALLSVSSYHMGSADRNSTDSLQYWHERGYFHKQKAENCLRAALTKDLPKSSRGKYKEILMSFLSMVTIGVCESRSAWQKCFLTQIQVFSGNMQDAHSYLAESETLIRNFGLPKHIKSQKVSKLHHIFSFLRIIEESTSLKRSETNSDANERANNLVVLENPSNPETALILGMPTTPPANSRLNWVLDDEPDDPEEDPLFVSIYQMPTSLLSLLSQTSSLWKQLQHPESSTPQFRRKCQIIEDRIFRWKAPQELTVTDLCDSTYRGSDSLVLPNSSLIAAHLVTAMHQALVVHFQRQIRNTDPRVLQHYVMNVADHLLAHEKLKQTLQISTAPFPWPGFIAGCEAYDPIARKKVSTYMDCVRSYTVGNLIEAEKVIREVWRRQDLGRSEKCWEDVLKDWGMHIVLT